VSGPPQPVDGSDVFLRPFPAPSWADSLLKNLMDRAKDEISFVSR
jgi:hypothetical protein